MEAATSPEHPAPPQEPDWDTVLSFHLRPASCQTYRHSMTSCHGPVFLNTPWLPGFRHHFPLRINQRKLDRTWPNLHTVIHILSAIQLSQPCRPHHISDFSIGNHITFPIEKLSIHRKYVSLLMYTLYIKNVIGLQFSSVTQLCPSLCDLMDCSTPGFPVHHQLPELAQTHVHRVGDTIQPSHPLSSPSPHAFNLSQN